MLSSMISNKIQIDPFRQGREFNSIFCSFESLFDLDLLTKGIDWLRTNITKPLKIYFQTSLVYEFTKKHLELFKKIDEVKDIYQFAEIVPISAMKNDNINRLLDV